MGLIGVVLRSQESPDSPPLPVTARSLPSVHEGGNTGGGIALLPPSKPIQIDIPAIDVHSPVRRVGLTAQGTLEVPAGQYYNDAAWYTASPTPGSLGPAIIVGHVDSADDGPSVFFDLGELRPDDKVLVTREDGQVATFRVDGLRRIPKDDFSTRLVYGDTSHAALRLITCGGTFDDATGHYVDNIVVFASLSGVLHRG